jgi:NADP-dependent 3-hydroxy acid dehydrogenase YdfG
VRRDALGIPAPAERADLKKPKSGLAPVRAGRPKLENRNSKIGARLAIFEFRFSSFGISYLMGKLEGKAVLITGASRGIGLAIARALDSEGAKLILVGRNRAALARAAVQIPGTVMRMPVDVTKPGDVKRLIAAVQKQIRRLDVLINNAGVFTFKPFAKTTLEDWRRNLETNLTSIFLTTQAALPLLKRSQGDVVNILSVSSHIAFPNCSAYAAAKFGALGLTGVLRRELRAEGIRVTAVLPGMTETGMKNELDFPVRGEDLLQPEDVAAAVLSALVQPRRAMVEEILLMPSGGALGGGD